MPIYDYRCPQCGAAFEKLVSFSKADEVACPECGHIYTRRLVSRIAEHRSGEPGAFGGRASCAPNSGGT